jgi:hypothetical protein
MSNVEGLYSVCFIERLSEAKPSFEILRFDIRYSAVRCSARLPAAKATLNAANSETVNVFASQP